MNILSFELNEWSAIIWAITTAFSFAVMQVLTKSIIHEINPQVLNVSRLAFALVILWSLEEVRSGVAVLEFIEWQWLALAAFCGPFVGRVSLIMLCVTSLFPRQLLLVLFHRLFPLYLNFWFSAL